MSPTRGIWRYIYAVPCCAILFLIFGLLWGWNTFYGTPTVRGEPVLKIVKIVLSVFALTFVSFPYEWALRLTRKMAPIRKPLPTTNKDRYEWYVVLLALSQPFLASLYFSVDDSDIARLRLAKFQTIIIGVRLLIVHIAETLTDYRTLLRERRNRLELLRKEEAMNLDRIAKEHDRQQASAQRSADNARRMKARASCENLFNLHEPEIKPRFNRSTMMIFMSRYMGDDHAVEYVEEQASELKQLILSHVERSPIAKVSEPPKLRTLAEVTQWFEEQKATIDAVADDKMKRSLMAQLKSKYADLTSRILDDIE